MKQLRFALIGCGFIGELHAEVINSLSNAKLVAVCNSGAERGHLLANRYSCKYYADFNDALADPEVDAVSICLPSGMHHLATTAAARAGKHVICEKPIDTEVSHAQEMVDVCSENNVCFSVIMQHRFDKPMLLLKKAIEDGSMGELLWGCARTIWYRDDNYFANPWRGTWQYDGGGALINQSIHYIDLLLSIFGDVRSLSGKCRKLLHKQIETEDVGVANLEFENGTIGTIEGTTVSYPGLYAELNVYGSKGTVCIRNDHLLFYRFEDGENPEFELLLNPQKANKLNQSPTIEADSHTRQYEDFVDAILTGRRPTVTGEDALKSLKVIKAIYTASSEKREVYIAEEYK